jgi:hypothetical protein
MSEKSTSSIIARCLHPSAFDEDASWSREIADQRQIARIEAQNLMRRNPARAREIVSEYKAQKLEKQATFLRERSHS